MIDETLTSLFVGGGKGCGFDLTSSLCPPIPIALFLLNQQLSIAESVTTEHSCHFGGRRFLCGLEIRPKHHASDLRLGGRVALGSNLGRAKTLLATRAPLIQEHQPSEYVRVG